MLVLQHSQPGDIRDIRDIPTWIHAILPIAQWRKQAINLDKTVAKCMYHKYIFATAVLLLLFTAYWVQQAVILVGSR